MLKMICGIFACVILIGCASSPDVRRADLHEQGVAFDVGLVLEQFHFAADQGLFDMYFGLMKDDVVFLGTDESERWGKAEFMEYARDPFSDGHGWTYKPRDRSVILSDDEQIAWVDEVLDHDRYGVLRGTAVLELIGEDWKIAQYNLTMLVPNEKMGEVVEVIRSPSVESSGND
mgnify:FL=1